MRKLTAIAAVLAIALAAVGCGKSSTSSSSSATTTPAAPANTSGASTSTSSSGAGVKVGTRTISGLGTILVDAQGKTLYVFQPDKHSKVTCTGACAAVWPPLHASGGAGASATGAVKQSLLASDPSPEGGSVVTYAGWPLYTYVADTSAGMATGQALNLNGGLWYVITPSGTIVTKKP